MGQVRTWAELFALVSSLGPTPVSRLKLRLAAIYLPLRDALPMVGMPRPIGLTIAFGDRTLRWQLRRKTDLAVAREILLEDEYAALPIRPPRLLLDLGSHIGFSILYFRSLYPEARIIGVEPDPSAFQCLKANTTSLDQVEIHQLAMTTVDETVPFFPAKQPWISSLHGGGESGAVMVQGRRLDTLLDDLAIETVDLLKIDIEGEEIEVLRASQRLEDVGAIVGELHERGDLTLRAELFDLLEGFDVRAEGEPGQHTTFTAVRRA
jgi:FkbM family methyltransferase